MTSGGELHQAQCLGAPSSINRHGGPLIVSPCAGCRQSWSSWVGYLSRYFKEIAVVFRVHQQVRFLK